MPDFYIGEAQIGDAQVGSPSTPISTLGRTDTSGTSGGTVVKWWSCKVTAPVDGIAIDMSCYFNMTGPGNYKFCVWADNGSGAPGTLLYESASDTHNTTPVLKTLSTPFNFSAGTLHLGVVADDWITIYTLAGSSNQFTEFNEDYTSYPTTPNPPTVSGQSALEVVISLRYVPNTSPAPSTDSKMLLFF